MKNVKRYGGEHRHDKANVLSNRTYYEELFPASSTFGQGYSLN
ncbi:MAG: hypothetical protein NVS4B12_27630 [Ktedonobacteraceae bacterium]